MDVAIFAVVTTVAVVSSLYLFAMSQIQHLKKNWVKYRCNPLYMPVAGLVGDNVVSNFTKCTMKGFQDYAGFIMDPLMAEFSVVNDTVTEIGSTMSSMRSMMGGVRGGFLGIIGSVFGKIENLMSQTQYIIIRMRTLLSRVVGVMMSFVYVFYTGMQTGESVMNGPIGKVASLCFDPENMIRLADGTSIKMADVQIGTQLASGGYVSSIYMLDGRDIPIFLLHGVRVTGSHKVKFAETFISVAEHPAAIFNGFSNGLVCFNTTDHRIVVNGIEFLDFVESRDPNFVNVKRSYIEYHYNGKLSSKNKIDSICHSGVTPFTRIVLNSGQSKHANEISIGDVLKGGEIVFGVGVHANSDPRYVQIAPEVLVSPSTWVFDGGEVKSAESVGQVCSVPNNESLLMYQFITSESTVPILGANGTELHILDELETTEETFHDMKDAIIKSGSFRGKNIVV